MPGTINGIGTKYYGKAKHRITYDQCESCGAEGALESYVTQKYFVVLFVPIIPLATYHVSSECPNCNRHRIITQKKWNKLKDKTKNEITEALANGNANEEFLIEKLRYFATFEDPSLFRSSAAEIITKGTTAPVYTLLGQLFAFFRDNEESLICFKKAQKLNNSDENREFLAEMLIINGEPEKAEPLVKHIFETANENSYWLLLLLAEGYMSVGNHVKAKTVLTNLKQVFTDEKFEPSLTKLSDQVTRYIGTSESFNSHQISEQKQDFFVDSSELGIKTRLVGPAIALFLVMLYFYSAFTSVNDRPVHLTNGTGAPYSVEINGTKYKIPAYDSRRISLDEGKYTLTMESRNSAFKSQNFELKTPFFSRPFIETEFVLNPDHQALIYRQKIVYSEYSSGNDENPFTYYSGDLLYSFTDIDYPFYTAPKSIQISEGSSVTKYGLNMMDDFDAEWGPVDAGVRILELEKYKRFLGYFISENPNNIKALRAFSAVAGNDSAIEMIRPYLDELPVLIEAHRLYQDCMELEKKDGSLVSEYQKRLDSNPSNGDLLYLTGRLFEGEEANIYYEKAINSSTPNPYAYNALAWNYTSEGKFKEALPLVKKATSLAPDNKNFRSLKKDLLMSQKRYSELLEMNSEELKSAPLDYELWGEKVAFMTLNRKSGDIPKVMSQYMSALKADDIDTTSYLDYLNMMISVSKNQKKKTSELCKKMRMYHFTGELLDGNVQNADSILSNIEESSPYNHLLLYSVAKNSGHDKIAVSHLKSAINGLENGTKDEIKAAKALSGNSFSINQIKNLDLYPSTKILVLTALGVTYSDQKSEAFKEAKKFNFIISPTQLLVNSVIKS